MATVVTKFGGSSLADSTQFRKVRDILLANPERKICVVSAPGKRFAEDDKITDLLYSLYAAVNGGSGADEIFEKISSRFISICGDLGLSLDIKTELSGIYASIKNGGSEDYAASRGEYLNGLILAEYMGWDFLDPENLVIFNRRGKYDDNATHSLSARVLSRHEYAVIPGFYGSMPDGSIKTFSRGGSDITGAIMASAANADLYENWTDVSGFLMADPRIVDNPGKIDVITYKELRELSYMGATVLHEDSIFPVYNAAIPINIKNTNHPDDSGTMIVPMIDEEPDPERIAITAVTGRKNFTVISIEKNGMNAELGFGRRVLSCIEKYGLPFEHMPSSIDTLCVVLKTELLENTLESIVDDIHRVCEPDSVEVIGDLALVATVGRNMRNSIGTSARLFWALAKEKINVRMIDQGSSELNIIVGVNNSDFERAIKAIHNAFTE